ncbi:hypothetical protein Esi_0064_0075 [Ectocarpus siliculosus]|uniref:EF-hand domain-containing protein n=1 Tax=Ectocarpus siliculosus TaxID=2880 RepID=D8LRB6_ECTSI|nr:hypothetical protein Esi_0064_0075 [Ectocarpus siliculosus]|eukprot:CBN75021.1 hypothetical protein Esi_0064_0075 [Ectocarpus siliculosus]
MQMRLLSPGEQGIIDHVLETFAAQVDGKSMRTRDFFNLMDSNRDNVLTRSELKEALVNRQLVLRDDQLTHLMAFLDVHGHGYVTLGDLHDGLRNFRAARHRTKIHGQSTRLPRPQPRPPLDSTAVTRLQSALLAPLTLFSAQAPVEGQGKHQRYKKNASEKRILEQEAGINFLDITDPEISSLADFLMDAEKAGGRPQGGLPSNPADHIPTTDAQQSKALRPLPLIMAALESAASRAPGCINRDGQQTGGIRGPGAAAVPCSAARVLWILRGLQRVWRQKDRRRKAKTLIQESADEFTDEKLSVAVSLFDVDGQGHIDLQDVMTVFRNARVDKFVRGRLPAAAIPSLVAIGRHLESRKITAHDFVQDAATSTIVHSSEPTPKRKRDAKRDQTQTATTAQLGALLFSELQLDAKQRNLVLECIEEDGLVSGANVAGAVRRARGELAHRKLERLEQQQGVVDGGRCWSSETGSQVSEISGSTCSIISPPRFRPQAGAAPTAEEGMLAPLQHKHQRDGFNQSDASLILGLFVKEGGGLRNLTGKSAASLWRGLKRRGRGVHACEDGRSAARRLRQLLESRDMKPHRWFATLGPTAESSAPSDERSSMERRVEMSSIIQGVQALGGTTRTGPPGEANTVHTASDDERATDSLEGTLSSNDGSYSSTAQTAGKNYKAQRTVQKLDELMSLQGRRLVVEFHQADTNRSGGVDPTELKKVMKNLLQPCSLLRFERKRRRERQEAAAATSQNAERWKGDFMEKMEALDKSKASNFLDVISTALRNRRWQIRDVFRDVDKGKSGALGVNDLLENTHLALGLKLDRGEAAALVSMLDTNGDKSIHCEELELALRLYRRYGWERHRWSRRKPFHEEFPSLSCLFRRTPRAEGGGAGLQQQQRNPALPRDTKVNRGDIVTALVRLRGSSSGGAVGGNRGRGQLLPAHGPNVQRRRVLLRAVRKVAHCCQTAGVRTAPALLATLAYFDFGPVDEARRKAGRMRAVDLWHWLRLLSAPAEDSGGSVVGGSCNNNANRTKGVHGQRRKKDVLCGRNKSIYGFGGGGGGGRGGAHKTVDEMVSGRLLDAEETALLLDALELRTRVQEARDAPATGATEDGPIVSVPAFWDLLVEHVPGLWDRELQERLEAEEARRVVRDERAAAEEKAKAATTVQKAVRRRQLHQKQVRLDRIKSNKAATRIQAMERGRIARHHAAAEGAARRAAAAKAQAEAQAKAELEESARRLAAATEERNAARAAVKIQCATRQRHAREEVSRRRRRQQEEAARLAAAVKIQSVARGRQARTAAEEELSRRREEAARLAAAVKIQSVARGRLARTAAEEELNQRQEEAARLAAAIKIQSVARGRLTREAAKEAFRRQQKEEARLVAVVKIQSVVRGWLARKSAKEAAEIAALDAAIAARQAKMTEEAQPGAGAADQGRGGWRKKSVVGARGVQGLAGLQVQVPPNDNAA